MKKLISTVLFIAFVFCLTACGSTSDDKAGILVPESENYEEQVKNEATNNADTPDKELVDGETNTASSEESEMKLFINDVEVPVIWEENASVAELREDASKGDIIVSMSMYSDFEQVGPLGKKYHSDDKQMTVHNGDIVLYNSSNIVLYYASNTWSYTRLGKMDLPEQEVIDLLANGDVTIKISRQYQKRRLVLQKKIVQTAGRDTLGEFAHFNDDILFGENWNNHDIDVKTRSILTVVALMSTGITDSSLKYHLQNAKNHGVTQREIAAIITHTAFYVGWPKGWAVFNLAKEVWQINEGDLPYEDETMRAHAKEMVFPIGQPNDAFAQYFIGKSYLAPVSTEQVGIFNVTFEPGCRNNWHVHHASSGFC